MSILPSLRFIDRLVSWRATAWRVRILILAGLCMIGSLAAAPIDDLASPDQKTRDAAAKVIRESYVPSPREHWEPLLKAIQIGNRRSKVTTVLGLLKIAYPLPAEADDASLGSYRLDDRWVLQCVFRGEIVQDRALVEDLRQITVEPPPRFTGVWTTYFVNGQPAHEAHYKNGAYFGECTTFLPSGAKSLVQHFGIGGPEGEETSYYPSGKVAYQGSYHEGSRVGTWTWYNEDGTVRSVEEQPAP